MSWSAKLAKPLKPRDHAELRTLGDARDYALKLPGDIAAWQVWQHAGELLLAAAAKPSKAAIAEATDQVGRALFLTYREDMSDARERRRSAGLGAQKRKKPRPARSRIGAS